MKLGRCQAWNFGSYSHVDLDLSSTGLGLIYGKTGAGKSTIPDIPCWTLFGVTAKDGAADDVRSWQNPDVATKAVLDVQLQDESIVVTRVRGKAGQNDLYWTEKGSDKLNRGKDLAETQKYLSARLGCDSSLYLSASYFCDFSPSGHFFVAKSKDRRELFEKVACLDFPVNLANRLSEARKASKREQDKTEIDLATISGKLEQLQSSQKDLSVRYESWDTTKEKREASAKSTVHKARESLRVAQDNKEIPFILEELNHLESQKGALKKLQALYSQDKESLGVLCAEQSRLLGVNSELCPTCLSPQDSNTNRQDRLKELTRLIKIASYDLGLRETSLERLYEELKKEARLRLDLRKLESSRDEASRSLSQAERDYAALDCENPFVEALTRLEVELSANNKAKGLLEAQSASIGRRVASLTLLYDMSFDLRGELLKKAVKDIEVSTNDYLDQYFDAEIRVCFDIQDSDSLAVTLYKSGFVCNFKQLSKGQRQLLRLCFSVSVMKASANSAGIHFDNLFFDEALDGLDDELKVKAFTLFSKLETEHASILLIDHAPSFQNMFSTRYQVTMDSDLSNVELEHE